MKDRLGGQDCKSWDDAVYGVSSPQCVLYLVLTFNHGIEKLTGRPNIVLWGDGRVLRLWCYKYISGIVLDHTIILIWILDLESRIDTSISLLDVPSRLKHQLVTSALPNLHINWSTTAIRPSASKMYNIFWWVMVAGYQLSMVTPYRQETLFVVAEETTIYSCSNGWFQDKWGVINIRGLTHLEIGTVTSGRS